MLDYFHLSKAIKRATAHLPYYSAPLWGYIKRGQKAYVKSLFTELLKDTEHQTKRQAVIESRRYIMNNWQGIMNGQADDYIGCSAEGHISHVLSARLSSRPMGWSEIGADQMARLRVYRANGGDVAALIEKKRKAQRKEKRILAFDKRIVKGKLNKVSYETLDNLTILNIGKKTGMYTQLRALSGL